MPLAPYSAGSLGPSQAAQVDQTAYENTAIDTQNRSDATMQEGRLSKQFKDYTAPQLMSSLGASGQFYSSAAGSKPGATIGAIPQAQEQYQNQYHDIETAFQRAHMELQRQQVFASMGLIL